MEAICKTNLSEIEDSSEYIRVRINSSRENKARGFYLLMTNGNTQSDKEYEFIVERRFLKILDANNIDFEELPLNPISNDDAL